MSSMPRRKCRDRDIAILVNDTGTICRASTLQPADLRRSMPFARTWDVSTCQAFSTCWS